MSKTGPANHSLNPTTHGGIPQMMARALAHYGVDSKSILAPVGLPVKQSQDTQARVPSRDMQQVWRNAVKATGDEAFGITFARQLHPAALHGLGFACAVSDTMYDALQRIVRYYRILVSAGEIILSEQDNRLRLLYSVPGKPGVAVPASLDAALALFLKLCRITRDEDYCPILIEMQRPVPAEPKPFEDFFGCDIRYSCSQNALYFDLDQLSEPLPMANPELARASDQVIIDYLQRFDQEDIVSRVRAKIIDWLPQGTPSQDTIAEALHMSARTLQRKLGASGEKFSDLLETIRSELARQYLATPNRSVGEVAYLLGFSEPANFSRSFKRWTGHTPAQFRTQG